MIDIKLEGYKLESYREGVSVKEKRVKGENSKNEGEAYYTNPSFHTSLEDALIYCLEQDIKTKESTSIDELLNIIQRSKCGIISAVKHNEESDC